MAHVNLDLPQSIFDEITRRAASANQTVDHFVSSTLAEQFGLQHATIFQVSTITALVEGVYQEAVTVGELQMHGDFGLGTFADLAGEMVVLDGHFYCVPGDGPVRLAADSDPVPYAVVSQFQNDRVETLTEIATYDGLTAKLDELRDSDNRFYAVRIDGVFAKVQTRAVCRVTPGTSLVEASKLQREFNFENVSGSIVGYWFPGYAHTLSPAGWHLHFIDDAREGGGHLLDVQAAGVVAKSQELDDLHISLPETKEFMSANLTSDPSAALNEVERAH